MHLNDFSRAVADQLFERFPDWREFARVEKNEHEKGFLRVAVPPPPGSDFAGTLQIVTFGQETTVSLDYHHTHYRRLWHGCFAFLSDVLAEKLVVASWWRGKYCRGSGAETVERIPELRFSSHHRPFDRIRVRSWRGTHDHDIDVT